MWWGQTNQIHAHYSTYRFLHNAHFISSFFALILQRGGVYRISCGAHCNDCVCERGGGVWRGVTRYKTRNKNSALCYSRWCSLYSILFAIVVSSSLPHHPTYSEYTHIQYAFFPFPSSQLYEYGSSSFFFFFLLLLLSANHAAPF